MNKSNNYKKNWENK